MKGLAIETMSSASPLRKKSLTSTSNFAIAIPKGFQDNLLVNSLTTKLKQRRNDTNHNIKNKENASGIINAKPPKQARKSSIVNSKKDNNSSLGFRQNDNSSSNGVRDISRPESGVSSIGSEIRKATDGRHRVDSAISDKLPRLSAGQGTSSSRASRRSNSADAFLGAGFYVGSLGTGRISRISASTSFYPCTDSTGLAFDSSGADYTIKVIKRDGVFQPIDKYAPGRQMSRDVDHGSRGLACDYELFTLPMCEDTVATGQPNNSSPTPGKYQHFPVSRGGKSDVSKKSMKVSWCTVMEHENVPFGPHEGLDSRLETNVTPSIPFAPSRSNNCKDNMAFKRPVYSSGRSGIESIGVKWTVPSVASVDKEEAQRQLPSACSSASTKPMWSWLITPETTNDNINNTNDQQQQQKQQRQRSSTRVTPVGQLSRASKAKESPTPSSLGRSNSMFDIRTQHCRDVHPVATAMNRQGTSVTKTKWHVPSSTSSTLDAKQVAMERLQMVKRPGKKIVYDSPGHRDEYGNVLKYQNGDNDDNLDLDYMIDEYKDAIMLNEMKAGDDSDGLTTTPTTRRDDTNSSPTKSISTFH